MASWITDNLIVQWLVKADIEQNIKASDIGPLWEEPLVKKMDSLHKKPGYVESISWGTFQKL